LGAVVRLSRVGDGGSKIDREAARGVVFRKLSVHGHAGTEVDEVIMEVVRDRDGVDQGGAFARVCFAQVLGCPAPAGENAPRVGERYLASQAFSGVLVY